LPIPILANCQNDSRSGAKVYCTALFGQIWHSQQIGEKPASRCASLTYGGPDIWHAVCILPAPRPLGARKTADRTAADSRPLLEALFVKLTGGYESMATATKSRKKGKLQIQPLGDRVVVQRDESQETTAGGIVLPDTAKDKPSRGTVLSVGTGKLLDDGSRGELQVKEGDRVPFTRSAPEPISIGEDAYLLMREDDILAVIE